MTDNVAPIRAKLEPEAQLLIGFSDQVSMSIAISLKRIADAVSADDPNKSGLIYFLDQIAVGVQQR